MLAVLENGAALLLRNCAKKAVMVKKVLFGNGELGSSPRHARNTPGFSRHEAVAEKGLAPDSPSPNAHV